MDILELDRAELEIASRGDVEIVSGHAARDKVVAVTGIDADETERRLAVAVGGGHE